MKWRRPSMMPVRAGAVWLVGLMASGGAERGGGRGLADPPVQSPQRSMLAELTRQRGVPSRSQCTSAPAPALKVTVVSACTSPSTRDIARWRLPAATRLSGPGRDRARVGRGAPSSQT